MTKTAILTLVPDMADWEVGHLMTELHSGRFLDEAWRVHSVGLTSEPIVTTGGLRVTPDAVVADVDLARVDLVVMPGGGGWQPGVEEQFVDLARRALEAEVPVAAICGATEALARAGLLDSRPHTSSAREVLEAQGYAGSAHYVDDRAVAAAGLVTAGPQSPVQFAVATLAMLELMTPERLVAYEAVLHAGDASAYETLLA